MFLLKQRLIYSTKLYKINKNTNIGGLSKPKSKKSVIGLFRRESTTSGSVAGSDPCLAAQLTSDLAAATSSNQHHNPPSVPTYYRSNSVGAQAGQSRSDRRRSISICAVTPIDETSEHNSDPLGALVEFKNSDRCNKLESSYCKTNRRRQSLFELNG